MKTRDVITRDGVVTDRVPVGIDPGWDHNVGMSWISPELSLGAKLARLPKELRGLITDKSMSPAFQEAISGNWKAHQAAVKAGSKSATDAQILGFLDTATMDGMSAATTTELKSSAIAAFDAPVSTWPSDWVDALPKELRNYRAVLWDATDGTLSVITQGDLDGKMPRVVLRPNVKTKFGQALALDRLDAVSSSQMASARYRLLVGKL